MRVAGTGYSGISELGLDAARADVQRSSTTEGATDDADGVKVSVSSEALRLAESARDGGIDTKKVEALRQAIEDGSFQIDSHAIADRILRGGGE